MPSAAEQQAALRGLSRLTERDLAAIWRRLDLSNPDKLAEPLAQVLEEIGAKYGQAAATLAADWYDEAREGAAVKGRFRASPATLPESERFEALSRWGVGPLFPSSRPIYDDSGDIIEYERVGPNPEKALSMITGGLSRVVLGMARATTEGNTVLDPSGPRYARHASANACAFCALMATRGAVYASEESALRVTGVSLGGTDYRKMRRTGATREHILAGSRARTIAQGGRKGRTTSRALGEKYHDDCHCTTVAVFPGTEYREAPYVKKWREAYADADSSNDLSKALSSMRQALGIN